MEKTFHITTFGCQMNEHDSEIMAGLLEERGYTQVYDKKNAEIIVINTCSVRENADKRFFGTLGQLKRRKRENPDLVVAVCGCMMQQKRITDKIKEKYGWVDIIFGTHNMHRLPELLEQVRKNGKPEMEIWEDGREVIENLPCKRLFKKKALVNITYGCNNYCTYCIVPYTRGHERSRKPEAILAEIRRLAADGVKEVMLLGQNVNSYKGDYDDEDTRNRMKDVEADKDYCTFAHLLRLVSEIDGIERIRFMTSHPKDLSDELIRTFGVCDKLCKSIHLPVQSGSDRVLKRMNRHYDREHYLKQVDKLREVVPDITMSTDIIVGFPGETEEDFQDTLDMVERVGYDSAFTFIYSVRNGTPAAKFKDQIPEEVKHERFNRLVEVVDRISAEKNAVCSDKIEQVMVEGLSKRNKQALSGRTEGFKLVNFPVDLEVASELGFKAGSAKELAELMTGEIIPVRIVEGRTFSLEGRMISGKGE